MFSAAWTRTGLRRGPRSRHVVANEIGDHSGIAGVIFGMPASTLPHEVRANIRQPWCRCRRQAARTAHEARAESIAVTSGSGILRDITWFTQGLHDA